MLVGAELPTLASGRVGDVYDGRKGLVLTERVGVYDGRKGLVFILVGGVGLACGTSGIRRCGILSEGTREESGLLGLWKC